MIEIHDCELTEACERPAVYQSMFVMVVDSDRNIARFAWGCDECCARVRSEHQPLIDQLVPLEKL